MRRTSKSLPNDGKADLALLVSRFPALYSRSHPLFYSAREREGGVRSDEKMRMWNHVAVDFFIRHPEIDASVHTLKEFWHLLLKQYRKAQRRDKHYPVRGFDIIEVMQFVDADKKISPGASILTQLISEDEASPRPLDDDVIVKEDSGIKGIVTAVAKEELKLEDYAPRVDRMQSEHKKMGGAFDGQQQDTPPSATLDDAPILTRMDMPQNMDAFDAFGVLVASRLRTQVAPSIVDDVMLRMLQTLLMAEEQQQQ